MANSSILAAFERFWQHVVAADANKADIDHSHDDMYYTESEIDTKVGGTVEITSDAPEHSNTVLTIDPSSEDVSVYTASEVDSLISNVNETITEKFSTVGTYKETTGTDKSIDSSSTTAVSSMSLDVGVWVVFGRVYFASNSTGRRQIYFRKNADDPVLVMNSDPTTSASTVMCASTIINVTSASTVYFMAQQNSGSALAVSNILMRAVRIV